VNLTTEGTADWVHWGLSTNAILNRKAGVAPQIAQFTKLGDFPSEIYTDNFTGFSWTDGTPAPSAFGKHNGIFVYGETSGFEFIAPADATPRTLKVYCGLYGAQGNFQAWLSDFSAPAFTSTSLSNVFGNAYGAYTLTYSAASSGQYLRVRYRSLKLFDQDFGNVTLQAATFHGNANPPAAVALLHPHRVGNDFIFSFASQSGASYDVASTPMVLPAIWQVLTNLTGNGAALAVTNRLMDSGARYYRVESKPVGAR